jgi:hypothetical protein
MSLQWKAIVKASGPWQLLELSEVRGTDVRRTYNVRLIGEPKRLCITPTADGGVTYATRDTLWSFKEDLTAALAFYLGKVGP